MGPFDNYPDDDYRVQVVQIPIDGFLAFALNQFFVAENPPEPELSSNVVQFPKRGRFAE